MKKYICLILVLCFLFSILPINSIAEIKKIDTEDNLQDDSLLKNGNGYRYNIQGWIYLYIEGEPYDRGYQYGALLAEEIVDLMTRWSNMIHNHPKIKPLNGLFSEERYDKISDSYWSFCKKQIKNMYWDNFPEEYQNEIKGIADGVDSTGILFHDKHVTFEDILTSNMMYEYLSKVTYHRLRKGFHPMITLLKYLQEEFTELKTVSASDFVDDFTSYYPGNHKCNGFIATGDATTNGQVVISNSMWSTGNGAGLWWWSYYLTFRWNIILDINPSEGYRLLMASAPGYIWSDHDFYQSENGIVFLETTCPQGLWDTHGFPLAVRARKAVQYSENIDDVMHYLKYRNDGGMNAVWVIGDTKTGEIARYEQGYRNSWYDKKSDGFHWSANNPMNFRVRLEKLHLIDLIRDFIQSEILGIGTIVYSFPRYRPSNRDRAYEELGNKYYGELSIDTVKDIMSSVPFTNWSPDCKITDSDLVQRNGMFVVMGNPTGSTFSFENLNKPTIEINTIPQAGWVRLYGVPNDKIMQPLKKETTYGDEASVVWSYIVNDSANCFESSSIIIDDILYSTTSTGDVNALNANDGSFIWSLSINEPLTAPVYYDGNLFFGSPTGLKILNISWLMIGEKPIGKIISNPVVSDGCVFVGNEYGDVYCFEISTGEEIWHITLPDEIYISDNYNDYLFISSGENLYKINKETGDTLWSYKTDGMITSKSIVSDNVVYFGSWDNYMYAVDTDTKDTIWTYETGWGIETTPVVYDDIILFGSHDSNFFTLNKNNGDLIWYFSTKAAIHSSPVIYDNRVVFGSDDGYLYILNAINGEAISIYSPNHHIIDNINYLTTPIISNPIIYKNNIIFGADGKIFALSE